MHFQLHEQCNTTVLLAHHCIRSVIVLFRLKEKPNSVDLQYVTIRELWQLKICDNLSVWMRSHHLNRSITCSRHWERCRLSFPVALLPVSRCHKSLFLYMLSSSRPTRPSLCRHPPAKTLDCIWIWKKVLKNKKNYSKTQTESRNPVIKTDFIV